ncbi:hypothetical protein LSH36_162g05055 [Paralvinella palmiformis]|uniref:Uncharacterized protein n=1 Tax=Paralvinella palmiformis TaxID=53620 RepID=A0AAD9JU05_9ANNE|nr:hypothetical protein LSH36_162g05055 [Paralvinella palmiformis]
MTSTSRRCNPSSSSSASSTSLFIGQQSAPSRSPIDAARFSRDRGDPIMDGDHSDADSPGGGHSVQVNNAVVVPLVRPGDGPGNGRWVQINNTVVPVIQRTDSGGQEAHSYIPLPVVKHGAGLFRDRDPDVVRCTPAECRFLSELCLEAGFKFEFPGDTDLILLDEIPRRYRRRVYVAKLPDHDPFLHAEFRPHGHDVTGTDDETKLSSPEVDCIKRDGSAAMGKNADEKAARGIWRPVSFSPDHQKKARHGSSDGIDCPDAPLDLSIRGHEAKHQSAGSDSSRSKKINNRRSQTNAAPTTPTTTTAGSAAGASSARSARRSQHRSDRRQPLNLQERRLFGQPIITLENNNKEYVSLSCLRHAFFPSVPSYAFPSIVTAVQGRSADPNGPEKVESTPGSNLDRCSPSDDKMVEFSRAEKIVIGVDAFIHAMANSQLPESALIAGYLPIAPWPGPLPEAATFRPLPADWDVSLSTGAGDRRPVGNKRSGIPDFRDVTGWTGYSDGGTLSSVSSSPSAERMLPSSGNKWLLQ